MARPGSAGTRKAPRLPTTGPDETVTVSQRKPAAGRVRIGEWVADPATNELRRGERSVRLEPKAMDVLMLLAGCPGEVVTREQLFAAVWPGTVVVDEALTQSVAKLRRALGDDPRSPAYIETVSKRGYRLTAPVAPGEAAAPKAVSPRRRRWPAIAAVAVLALLAAGTYWLVEERAPPPSSARPVVERSSDVTVTVLPFEALGAEPGQAYFARGIGDSLMTELGRLSSLRVASAGGRYTVSGSVQRDAAMLRINVRLVDASSGEQLWSERFERPYADLFPVQDEIIRKLVESLPARMTEAERQRLARRHTRSLEAYDHFLRAQALFMARRTEDNERARELYRRAIEADPRFARAYAGLAMTHAIEHRLRGAGEAGPALERARELAESARLIDPEIAEVHWALGFVHAQARRHAEAIAELQRVVELNPSFADAYALLGGIHTYVGEPAKSIPLLRTAMRLDPESGYLYFLLLGRAYFFQGDLEQALFNLREAEARNPADLETRLYLAAALAGSGDRRGAEWQAEEIRTLQPGFSLEAWLAGYPLTSAPLRDKLGQSLSFLRTPSRARRCRTSSSSGKPARRGRPSSGPCRPSSRRAPSARSATTARTCP